MQNMKHDGATPLDRRIHCLKKMIFPLDVSTGWVADEELRVSCAQLHAYVCDAYDDILRCPAENFVDPENAAYNDTYSWADMFASNLSFHKSTLVSFLEASDFVEPNVIVISNASYDKMYKKMRTHYNGGRKTNNGTDSGVNESIPRFEDAFALLNRRGIVITRGESETVITNDKYPQMFPAAKMLLDAVTVYNKKTKRTPRFGFDDLDFRVIDDPFRKYAVDDVYIPLTSAEEAMTRELIAVAETNGLKCKFNTASKGPDGADYGFYRDKTLIAAFLWRVKYGYRIDLYPPSPWENAEMHDRLAGEIDKRSDADDIKDFCAESVSGCTFCNKGCVERNAYKMKMDFLGRKMARLPAACGGFRLRFELDELTFPAAKAMIELMAIV
jgi:hypothetical protein